MKNVKPNFTEQQKQDTAEPHAELGRIVSRKEARELGLTRYFTGKPCKRGHNSERGVNSGDCVTCRKMRKKGLIENINKSKGFWLVKENVLSEAKKYKTKSCMKAGNSPAYIGLCELKLGNHAFPKGKKTNGYWTREKCFEAAKLYEDKASFSNGDHKAAYVKLCKLKLIESATEHMNKIQKGFGYWTYERCRKEAMKYKTRNEFRQLSAGTYHGARDKGWLEEICQHMESGYKTSDTVYIWKVLGFDDLYKIGLSNKSVCNNRINIVASAHGYEVENTWIFHVGIDLAYITERECLKFGNKADVDKKDGYTEFRHLSEEQFSELLKKLDALNIRSL